MSSQNRIRRDDATDDKEHTLRRLEAFNAQLQTEAQIKRDAALWRRLCAESPEFTARMMRLWQVEQ